MRSLVVPCLATALVAATVAAAPEGSTHAEREAAAQKAAALHKAHLAAIHEAHLAAQKKQAALHAAHLIAQKKAAEAKAAAHATALRKQAAAKAAKARAAGGAAGSGLTAVPGSAAKAGKNPVSAPASVIPGNPAQRLGASAPATVFQTNLPYDPRIDLKTDAVAVHSHGATDEEIDHAIRTWKTAGYPVHRMFFIGSDAGGLYTTGKIDGMPHPGDIETDAAGHPITIGDRPYMVPTDGWLNYLKEQIRKAIDSGAEGIWPEEPLLHAAGGYSPAFKTAWQQLLQSPWQPPQDSPTNYYKASRVKAELYLHAVDELCRYTRDYAKQQGKTVRFYLPVHSPIGYAGSNLIFPHAAASRLPIDGVVAQVWSGPARAPLTYEGVSAPDLFAGSWMMYSYFANLLEGVPDKSLQFLADPVEDNPSFHWDEYERWYHSVLASSLLFPQANGYEVMPWPDRIYLPGGQTGGGTPGPAPYLTQLSGIIAALREVPSTGGMEWSGGTRGIGVLTLDSMMWQRGGPQGSSMRSLYGLVLPLLKRGIPAEIVPAERVSEKAYLSRFKVLLLSYDMQKPDGPEIDEALADWVRAGGTLIVFGGEDAYNRIGEWWSRDGFPGPTDHLLQVTRAAIDPVQRSVQVGESRYREALKADSAYRALENRKVYTLPLSGLHTNDQPVYLRFHDLFPNDGWGAWVGRVRILDNGRVRADFHAGSVGEKPFLVEDVGSHAGKGFRYADGEASFAYRFNHLSADAQIELELGNQFKVDVASGADPEIALQPASDQLPALRVPSSYPVISYPLTGAESLFRTPDKAPSPAWVSPSGAGWVVYCGLPAAFGADSSAGADLVRGLVRIACGKEHLEYREGPIIARRGPYVVAHALDQTVQLKGTFLDLFHADLPLVENPRLPYRDPVLLKEVHLLSRIPVLLHASNRATVLESSVARLKLNLEGPQGTGGVLRIYPAGMTVAGVEATTPSGEKANVQLRVDGRTLRVRYTQLAGGLNLTIRWIRPEARLTK